MNYSLYVRIRRIVYRLVLKKCLITISHEYFIGHSIIQSFMRFNGIIEVNKAHHFHLSMRLWMVGRLTLKRSANAVLLHCPV